MKIKDIVAKLETSIGVGGHPVRLREAIERVLQEDFNQPELQAVENAELLEEKVRDIIDEEEKNSYPKLAIVASAEHLVAGYCYISSSDSVEVATAKRNRLNISIPCFKKSRSLHFKNSNYLVPVF